MGLMVPPDLVLSTLLAQSGASIQQRGVVGAKGYRIIATEAPPVWQTAPKEAPSNTLITTAGGSSAYFRPVKGVTISVPGGGDALRKAVMLKNALRSNCSRMTYTRPVFDIQLQTNLHLETPRLTLLGSPYQQQHNYHQQPCRQQWAPATSTFVTAAVWNLPSIKLLYHELISKHVTEKRESVKDHPINTENRDINRAIREIQACSTAFGDSSKNFAASEGNPPTTASQNNREMAVTSAVNSIISSATKKSSNAQNGSSDSVYDTIDKLALGPALLRRSGTGPFMPPASKA